MIISAKSVQALFTAVAQTGKNKGYLKAKAPPSRSNGYAAWQAAKSICNPHKVFTCGMPTFTNEQKEVYGEVKHLFDALNIRSFDRNRNILKDIGLW